MNRRSLLILLAVLLCVPAAFARKSVQMTPALKARLDAIGAAERAEIKPLQDKEHELLKKRNALAQAKVKAHPPIKSKEEAKILSHEISADPAIAAIEEEIKAGRAQMKEKRAAFAAQRQAAVDEQRTAPPQSAQPH
jgi:hypothetical protein